LVTVRSSNSTLLSVKRVTRRPTSPDPKEYLSKDRPMRLIADAEAPEAAVEDPVTLVEAAGVRLPQTRVMVPIPAAKRPRRVKKEHPESSPNPAFPSEVVAVDAVEASVPDSFVAEEEVGLTSTLRRTELAKWRTATMMAAPQVDAVEDVGVAADVVASEAVEASVDLVEVLEEVAAVFVAAEVVAGVAVASVAAVVARAALKSVSTLLDLMEHHKKRTLKTHMHVS